MTFYTKAFVLTASLLPFPSGDDGDSKTHNIFTEIIYSLSPTRNISVSLKTFGISEVTTDIIAVVPDATASVLAVLRGKISGDEQEPNPTNLQSLCQVELLQRVYGINSSELKTSTLVESIVTRMGCRDTK